MSTPVRMLACRLAISKASAGPEVLSGCRKADSARCVVHALNTKPGKKMNAR